MGNIIGSISIIKNFMANASRTTCNEYLYDALKDAVECMEQHTHKNLILKCDGCKNNDVECMHCMRAYSDCYEKETEAALKEMGK